MYGSATAHGPPTLPVAMATCTPLPVAALRASAVQGLILLLLFRRVPEGRTEHMGRGKGEGQLEGHGRGRDRCKLHLSLPIHCIIQ